MFTYSNENYEGVNFSSQDLRYGELVSCTFTRCNFSNGSLEEIMTKNCRFIDCKFQGASLNGSIHAESAFENCNFSEANLFVSKFENCKMTGSDFSNSNMDGITILLGDWSYTNLRHTRLARQDLRGVRFYEADFSEANLEKTDLRKCDLTRATLSKAKLQGADIRGAKMDGVDFKTFALKGKKRASKALYGLAASSLEWGDPLTSIYLGTLPNPTIPCCVRYRSPRSVYSPRASRSPLTYSSVPFHRIETAVLQYLEELSLGQPTS